MIVGGRNVELTETDIALCIVDITGSEIGLKLSADCGIAPLVCKVQNGR